MENGRWREGARRPVGMALYEKKEKLGTLWSFWTKAYQNQFSYWMEGQKPWLQSPAFTLLHLAGPILPPFSFSFPPDVKWRGWINCAFHCWSSNNSITQDTIFRIEMSSVCSMVTEMAGEQKRAFTFCNKKGISGDWRAKVWWWHPALSVVKQKVKKRENRGNFLRCLLESLAGKGRQ